MRGEGGPRGDRAARQDRLPRSPTTPAPLTSAFNPGEEGPQRSAGSRRAPDSAAPGGVRPAPEWRELGAAPRGRGLGYCIVVCGPDPGCSTPPPALLCAGVLPPRCPGATPRAGPQPPPRPPASPTVSNRNGRGKGCRLS